MSTTANPNPTPEQAARIAWHAMFVARVPDRRRGRSCGGECRGGGGGLARGLDRRRGRQALALTPTRKEPHHEHPPCSV